MANNILKYSSKDYKSISKDLIDCIPSLTGTWTSREDGDPGIVLVKLMSAVGDMLSFYFDRQALEYYGPTVTQRKNAAKLFELVGYKMHWYRSALTTVTITNNARLSEYISFCKRIVGGENPVDVYYDYRVRYIHNATDTTNLNISIPPVIDNSGNIPLPNSMVAEGISRYSWNINSEGSSDQPPEESIKENVNFINNSNIFASYAKNVFSFWQKDNAVGLYTYIAGNVRTLGLYSTETNSIPYSLIPTTEEPVVDPNTGKPYPNDLLLPYEPKTFKAIQGSLRSKTFTHAQLKNDCFYVPDASLDEEYMYLSYTTIDSNTMQERTVFIEKTDNLLTVTDFKNTADPDNPKIYFQFAVDDFDFPYIQLSSYWKDQLGEDTVKFTFYYFKTNGRYGSITSNYLNRFDASTVSNISVTNLENSDYVLDSDGTYLCKPGYNPQTSNEAYLDSINYVMTFNSLVTIYDFIRFTKRQEGISNAFASDGQYAQDLNKQLRTICDSYTESQLRDILGSNAPQSASKSELSDMLYNIRKVSSDYTYNCYTIQQAQSDVPDPGFIPYGLNIYPVYGNFTTVDSTGASIATQITNVNGTITPYTLYKIYTQDDNVTANSYKVETMLNEAYRKTRVVIVKPSYTACRVFDWRCCGTIHLTQSVSSYEAKNIIKNVINYLKTIYQASNMQFGKKITYMEVIDSILASDSRIRYFDAGMGNKKLIDYSFPNKGSGFSPSNYFNIDAYFNSESLMRYVQTYEETVENADSDYYNMLSVDPGYIQG